MSKEFTQEHIMKICLAPELYMAMTKLQVQKEKYDREIAEGVGKARV